MECHQAGARHDGLRFTACYSGTPWPQVYHMPTVNPRVQVTLTPTLDVLVRRLAGLQRSSKSQVLRELLEAAEPALHRAVALMEAASKAKYQVHAGLGESLMRSQQQVEDILAGTLTRLDEASSDLVSQAEAVGGRRPARSARSAPAPASDGPRNPPASNRGVKSPGRGRKEAHQALVLKARRGAKS